MQTVLAQLNSLPGVVGSLVCGLDGQLVARVFPPVYDATALEDAARALTDGANGLDISSETAELLDFRFKEGRLLAKPLTGSMLVVLCTKATNVQFLILSLAAAAAKLDRLQQAQPRAPAVPADAPAASAASAPAGSAGRGAGSSSKKRVAAPTRGLDELRRRLAEAAGPRPDGAEVAPAAKPPVESGPPAKQGEPQAAPNDPGVRWWEGMP